MDQDRGYNVDGLVYFLWGKRKGLYMKSKKAQNMNLCFFPFSLQKKSKLVAVEPNFEL